MFLYEQQQPFSNKIKNSGNKAEEIQYSRKSHMDQHRSKFYINSNIDMKFWDSGTYLLSAQVTFIGTNFTNLRQIC